MCQIMSTIFYIYLNKIHYFPIFIRYKLLNSMICNIFNHRHYAEGGIKHE